MISKEIYTKSEMDSIISNDIATKLISKCHYCNTKLNLDKAGNCKNCGTGDVPIMKVEIPIATFYTTQLAGDFSSICNERGQEVKRIYHNIVD